MTSTRALRAAVLLPVLLFSLAATSYATWRCRVDGIARSECCCPKDQAAASTASQSDGAAVEAPECCVVEQHRIETVSTDISRGSALAEAAALVAVPVAVLPAVSAAVDPDLASAAAPPRAPGGRAIVVHKHAFLI